MYRSNQSRLFWIGLVMGTCITLSFTTGLLRFNGDAIGQPKQTRSK